MSERQLCFATSLGFRFMWATAHGQIKKIEIDRSSVRLVIRRHLPGPSLTPIITPRENASRARWGFLPRLTPVLPPSALSHLLDGWTYRHFTLPSPSTKIQIFHPIRRDVRRGGCDDRCPLPPIHGKPDALLLREHYPLLPVGHARTFLGEKSWSWPQSQSRREA